MKKILLFCASILFITTTAIPALSQTVTTKYRCHFFDEHMDWGVKQKSTIGQLKDEGTIIGTIPAFKEVQVVSIDKVWYTFYKVRYKNKVGLIHRDVVVDKSLILSLDPKIREEYRPYAKIGSIALGMNIYEVTAILGMPQDINRTVSINSETEQWCYTSLNKSKYVYFERGIVTSFQD